MAALQLQTYVSPYAPIPSTVPGWDPDRQATWPATTASLLSVGGRAVLVDALMTVADGEALAGWVGRSGSLLDTVYVTHAHADHFFGATSLLSRLPGARLLTHPDVVEAAAVQTAPGFLRVWNGFFPGQLADPPLVPAALDGDLLAGAARAVQVGSSDVEVSTVVHVPDLAVVVAGDVVYNGVHPWLAGSTPDSRAAWLAALDAVERLAPRTIVAGHRDPGARDDDAGRLLEQTRAYVRDFDDAVLAAGSPGALVAAMTSRHSELGNPYTLEIAAQSQYEQSQYEQSQYEQSQYEQSQYEQSP